MTHSRYTFGMKKLWFPAILLWPLLLASCDLPSLNDGSSDTSSTSLGSSSVSEESSASNNDGSSTSVTQDPLNWQLMWQDEFDYNGLPDPTKWGYDVGGGGWGNNELQYYTNADLDNAKVENGQLTITARRETIENRQYSSARLVSRGKGDFLYGRMEARAKLPRGRGTWAAIWMLPTDWVYGGWPTSGEIDIMEHVGYDPNVVHATIHTDTYNHMKNTQLGNQLTLNDVFDTFHDYVVEWEPGLIRAYINDTLYATFAFNVDDIKDGPSYLAWPFDQDFHFILNIAIGGSWGGVQGVDDSIFPTSMVVDHVRVYQKPYGEGDTTDPTAIQDPMVQHRTANSVAISWKPASDNRKVKEYTVRVNGALYATASVPAIYIDGLTPETNYQIDVIAVDFNNNLSPSFTFTATTAGYPTINERIEAEAYTSQSGVQFQSTTDFGGGDNAGWFDAGDYLEYLVQVPTSGQYQLEARIAGLDASGQFSLSANQVSKISIDTPITGGWQSWQTITSSPFSLSEGLNTIRLQVTRPGFNLNYFRIIHATST
jgi:beta-glucanase (GH16 family)